MFHCMLCLSATVSVTASVTQLGEIYPLCKKIHYTLKKDKIILKFKFFKYISMQLFFTCRAPFFCHTGVDVMITTSCNFWQLSAKNGVFLKNNCYGQIFALFSFVLRQNGNFLLIFLAIYLKSVFGSYTKVKILERLPHQPWNLADVSCLDILEYDVGLQICRCDWLLKVKPLGSGKEELMAM
jgi:hypothetical protein